MIVHIMLAVLTAAPPPSAAEVPDGLAPHVRAASVERHGPVTATTLELAFVNDSATPVEAIARFAVPNDALVARLALAVDGRWMEAEVMPIAFARQSYEHIVRPARSRPRDPALLREESPGRWVLQVFPVPPRGERRVRLEVDRLAPAGSGIWFETRPARGDDPPSRWFAITTPTKPAHRPWVVALDTSMSMRHSLSDLAALGPILERRAATLVTADPRDGHPVLRAATAAELAAPVLGGGGDNARLVAAALAEAERVGGEVVLVTDGRALPWIPTGPAVHILALGRTSVGLTWPLAGGAVMTTVDELERALAAPTPRVRVEHGTVADLAIFRGTVFGRVIDPEASIDVDGREWDLAGTAHPGVVFARFAAHARIDALGRLATAEAMHEAVRLGRVAGIASHGGALLAFESDADYRDRQVARIKDAELAALEGRPAVALPPGWDADPSVGLADRDGDGVPDVNDGCPDQPGPGGCPPIPRVIIEQQRIRILEHVYFAAGSARPLPISQVIIDEVARVMADHPDLTVVGIEGHADRHEGAAALRLSKARAEAVRRALVRLGVDPNRLAVIARGATRPIDPVDSARNRRVSFFVAVRYGEPYGPEAEAIMTGLAKARLVVARARAATDEREACPLLDEALALVADDTERLSLFDERLARACLDRFVPPLERELGRGRTPPAQVLGVGLDVGSSSLVTPAARARVVAICEALSPDVEPIACAKALGRSDDPRAPAIRRRRIDAFLAPLVDWRARIAAGPEAIDLSAKLLALDGRPDEAAVRAAEIPDLREPPEP